MKTFFNIVLGCLLVCYPFFVFFGFKHFDPRLISITLVGLLIFRFLLLPSKTKAISLWTTRLSILAGLIILFAVSFFNKSYFIKLYPVFMSGIFFLAFTYTLRNKPSMIERFARIQNKKLPKQAIPYLKKVTILWCGFFLINAAISLYTCFYTSLEFWIFYNGFLSYIIMGTLFILEFIFRQWKVRLK